MERSREASISSHLVAVDLLFVVVASPREGRSGGRGEKEAHPVSEQRDVVAVDNKEKVDAVCANKSELPRKLYQTRKRVKGCTHRRAR